MAKVQGTFYTAERLRRGTSPVSPPYSEDEGQPYPVNPPGSGVQTYLTLADTKDGNYLGKNGFVPVVTNEDGLTLMPVKNSEKDGLINPGVVQWTGIGYDFNVSSALARFQSVVLNSNAAVLSLTTPDATNDRIDLFILQILFDGDGIPNGMEADFITGTPAGSPVKPQIDPATQIELTQVTVTAASSTPTLTEEVIYDENIEWTGSSSGTGTVAFNSAANPFQGSLSIEATNIQNGLKIRLTDGSDYDMSGVQTLGMQLDLKAQMFAGQNIGVTFLDSTGAAISTELTLNFDKISTDYQFIGIALSQFSFTSFLARSIEFRYIRTKGATVHAGFFLDIIKLEGGINPPVTAGSFISLTDTPSSYSGQASKVVSVKADETGLEFTSGGGGGADTNAVHYNAADGKNATERNQARVNTGSTSGTPQVEATGGAINDFAYTSNHIVFSGASVVLSGIVAGQDGEEITILNVNATALSILNQSALSSANNRVIGALSIPQWSVVRLKYRTATNRWVSENVGLNDARYLRKDQDDATTHRLGVGGARISGTTFSVITDNSSTGADGFIIQNTVGLNILAIRNSGGINVQGSSTGIPNMIRNQSIGGIIQFRGLEDVNVVTIARNGTIVSASVIEHARSTSDVRSIRRDEQRLYYLVSVTTSGVINDQALTDGIFNYRFTAATSITGFANGEIGRTIDISNDSGSNMTLAHESVSSIAANRIYFIGVADLIVPNKGKVTLKYCTGSRWELICKNF